MSEVTGVSQELWFGLISHQDHAIPLHVKLSYSKNDPWAVCMRITHEGSSVLWTFARELLIEGTIQFAGWGDLRIWPTGVLPAPGQLVNFEFHNFSGYAVLQGSRAGILGFLKRTLDLVPIGAEPQYEDVDAAIALCLASEAA